MFSIADIMETFLYLELSLGVRICSILFTMYHVAVIMSNFYSLVPSGETTVLPAFTRIAMVSMPIVLLVTGLDMSYLQAVGVMVIHFVLICYYHKGLKSLFGQLACSAPTSFCANCWKEHPKPVSLKKCKCKCLQYCNAACKKEHWERIHKYFCKTSTPFDPLDPLEAGDMMSIFCHLSFHFRIEGKLKERAESNRKAGFTNCEQKKGRNIKAPVSSLANEESRRSDVRPKQIEQEMSNDKQMTWEQDCVSGKAYYLSKDYAR